MDRKERYEKAYRELELLFEPGHYELDPLGKMATIASVLHREFPEWPFVGFYRVFPDKKQLIIGPYQGSILACGSIDFGRGVCGTVAETETPRLVPDVSKFPGYIACDAETKSEVVVPVFDDGTLMAVLDVDSSELNHFSEADTTGLQRIAGLVY